MEKEIKNSRNPGYCTFKKVSDFPGENNLNIPAKESLESDIPAGDGKTTNFFLQCGNTIESFYMCFVKYSPPVTRLKF
jgi:hypothetical protein